MIIRVSTQISITDKIKVCCDLLSKISTDLFRLFPLRIGIFISLDPFASIESRYPSGRVKQISLFLACFTAFPHGIYLEASGALRREGPIIDIRQRIFWLHDRAQELNHRPDKNSDTEMQVLIYFSFIRLEIFFY